MNTLREMGLPVREWVPNWLALVCVFVVILPVTMLNGSYAGSTLEVSNTLGTNTEDITMGYYAASAGMALAYPIVSRILDNYPAKGILLIDLTCQFFLSWICARSQNADILIVCSFAVGFLKGFLMLWFIRYAQKIFSPANVRSEFYSYFYPLVYGGGQLSLVLTAELAYHYDWKYMYYFMMILLLVAILAVAVCLRHDRHFANVRWKEMHAREIFLVGAGLLMLMYVINYGKVLDWMSSYRVCVYIVLAPALLAFFIWYQHHSKDPYVSLAPLYQPKAIVGYIYMMLAMFFNTSTTLLSNYLTSVLKVDSTHTYSLYIWVIPGYLLSGFICFWWFRWQRWRFRFLVAGGMACFALFFGILYFGISPDSTYEMLYFPLFIRGVGMLTLIVAFALFAVEDLDPKYLLSNAFFLIIFRSVLAPISATAFYNNMLYRLEQKYMYRLSETVTLTDPLAASRYSDSFSKAMDQGHGSAESVQMAVNSLYNTLQQQAVLLSLKEILGWLFVITLVLAVVSRFIPFHKTIRVTFARTGDDMV